MVGLTSSSASNSKRPGELEAGISLYSQLWRNLPPPSVNRDLRVVHLVFSGEQKPQSSTVPRRAPDQMLLGKQDRLVANPRGEVHPHCSPRAPSQRAHEAGGAQPRPAQRTKCEAYTGGGGAGYSPPGPGRAQSRGAAGRGTWSGAELGTEGRPPAGKVTAEGKKARVRRARSPRPHAAPTLTAQTHGGTQGQCGPRRQGGPQLLDGGCSEPRWFLIPFSY